MNAHSPSPPQSPSPTEPSQLLSAHEVPAPPRKRAIPPGTAPYWMPLGIEGQLLPKDVRSDIVSMLNLIYKELVLAAKPGLAQSTGVTIVHLMWLEILDQLELGRRAASAQQNLDPLNILNLEPLERVFDRHLRLIHSKLKASDLLLRLEKFNSRARPKRQAGKTPPRQLSTTRRRPRKPGKNDFC